MDFISQIRIDLIFAFPLSDQISNCPELSVLATIVKLFFVFFKITEIPGKGALLLF